MEGNGRKANKARNDHSPKKKEVTKKCKLIGYHHTSLINNIPTSKQTNCKLRLVIV